MNDRFSEGSNFRSWPIVRIQHHAEKRPHLVSDRARGPTGDDLHCRFVQSLGVETIHHEEPSR